MKLGHGLVGIGLVTALAVGCSAVDDSTQASVGGVSARPGGGTAGGSPGGSGSVGGTGAFGGTTGGTAPLGGVGGSGNFGGIPGTVVPSMVGGGPAGSNTCQITNVDFLGDTPDMLIVMDRSQSLVLDPLNNRWDPARNAVKQITQDWEQLIGFGLEFFPGDGAGSIPDPVTILLTGGSLDLGPMCAGNIKEDVPIAARNAMPIAQALDRAQPIGFTPTGAALQQALRILGDRNSSLDTRVKPGFVLLVTDGDPMCDITSLVDPTLAAGGDVAQQQAAMQAVMALKAAAIPTYVFGYQIDPTRQGYMNMLAQAGGTNMYYPVENQASIIEAFRTITKDVVRCEFELGMAPPDPSFVRIEIDNKTIPYNTADGWTLTNGTHVTLQGAACSGLKDGKVHNLNAQIECNPVILN